MTDNPAVLTVVGIGADGWPGLTGTATAALTGAEVIFGSSRQLALLPESVAAELHPWPTPLVPALRGLLESRRGRRIAVLASGDPMFHGIGATLIRLVGAASVRVIPSPSSVSLAAARLGWPLPDVDVLSLVSAPVEELHPLIHPGRKILILSAGARTPAAVAALLTSRGYADSVVTVLSQLGGPAEELIAGTAANLGSADFDPLNVVAVVCSTGADVSTRPSRPAAPWAGSPKSSGTDAGHSAGGHSAGGHSAGGRMDGGQADGGHADARHLESGHADVGCLDGGHADGGHPDFAHADDGHADGGRSADGLSDGRNLDVSHADGGRQDAGHFDGGRSVGGHSDGGHPDAGHLDGGHLDSGHMDSGHTDSGLSGGGRHLDGGRLDGGLPDGGRSGGGRSGGGRSGGGNGDPVLVGPRPLVPGLSDSVYASDGQLTKREVRAVTLALLGPQPGELLWDIGAGSGSIAIEWMRTHRDCRAIAIESSAERVERIVRNAAALGVPKLRVVEGRAPGALAGLPAPDVVFVGGGLTRDGVVEAALAALPAGGRLVANAVTLESEAVLAAWYARLGGELTRIAVNRASPVGGFTGWRAMMPVTIWSVIRP